MFKEVIVKSANERLCFKENFFLIKII